jgi:regulator of nonsense transcripts 3
MNDNLKVVVRRLPPTLPEEVFWSSVEPYLKLNGGDDWQTNCDWRVYVSGRGRKGCVFNSTLESLVVLG